MRLHRLLLLAAATVCVGAPARANVTVYYHVGVWDAFDGQGDNSQPLCGVGTRNPADGRTFSLRFEIGGNAVTFVATKPGWNIPDNTQLPVVMQIGLAQPWSEHAVGSGNRVQWTLDRGAMQAFDAQFRGAASMTVTFPSGTEQPWVLSLAGSTAVSNAMGRCVTDLTRRAAAQPEAAPAQPQPSATQPFGAAPAAMGNPAPVPPAPPAQQAQPATPSH